MAGIHQTLKETRSLYAEAVQAARRGSCQPPGPEGLRVAGRDVDSAAQVSGGACRSLSSHDRHPRTIPRACERRSIWSSSARRVWTASSRMRWRRCPVATSATWVRITSDRRLSFYATPTRCGRASGWQSRFPKAPSTSMSTGCRSRPPFPTTSSRNTCSASRPKTSRTSAFEGMIAVIAACADARLAAHVFAELRELRRKVDAEPGQRHEFECQVMSQLEAVFRRPSRRCRRGRRHLVSHGRRPPRHQSRCGPSQQARQVRNGTTARRRR